MKKTIVLFLVGSILATASFAFAGNREGAFSISPVVGGVTFSGEQHLQTSPLFGGRTGYNFTKALGVEALFDYAKTKGTKGTNSGGTLDFYRYGGDLLYHFWPDNKFVPYLAAGYAGMNLKGSNPYPGTSKTKGVLDYGLGFKYFVTQDMAWRGDVRGLSYKYDESRNAIEYTTGVYIYFGSVPPVAKLPDPPPPPAPVSKQASVAVPPPAPMASLSASPASILKGDVSTLSWTAKNAKDCEISPAIGQVQVPGQSTVKPESTTIYTLTCTGDGGSVKSEATVTVIAPPPVVVLTPAAKRFCNKPANIMINFDSDKYNIKPQYHNELKSVGDFLKEFPTSYGEISGHTDSTHTNAYNQKLSERRANSVKEYIIKNFDIAPERLTSRGYGEDKPIANNKTKEGRARNRRMVTNFVCN